MNELLYSSVTNISKAIRNKEISSQEIVRAYLDRIEEVNPKLNAVVQQSPQKALEQALKADEALAHGTNIGPLHGVPMTLKDSFDTAGMISTGGTLGRKDFVPSTDATILSRLRNAGAILLGKTNTPELTLLYETQNLIYGRTNNPYSLEHSAGGSSGGAASIVAAGGSAFDIGTDYGGSLRYPAHCCGVATIKPTSGRVPRTGHILPFGGVLDSFQQVGPITRYVEDLNLILPIIIGPDWIDPSIVPMPFFNSKNVNIKKLRIAFHTNNGIISPSEQIVKSIQKAVTTLRYEGAEVEEIKPKIIEQTYDMMMGLLSADGGTMMRRLLTESGTKENTLPWLEVAQPIDISELDNLMVRWSTFRSNMLKFIKNYDVILSPVNAYPALPHGSIKDELHAFSYCMTYNLTGWPAAVVRVGTEDNLPIGIQIISQPWREDISLAVAEYLEKSLGGFEAALI